MPFDELRYNVWAITRKLYECDLIRLSAGNVSAREGDHVAITPSGVMYDRLQPEDILIINRDGQVVDGRPGLRPSSEYQLHTAILRELPAVCAVVHTHSTYALTFSALGREIAPVSIELVAAGGAIPVAPYACPGTPEVGQVSVEILKARPELKGLLLQNHGLVSVGATLEQAYEVAYDIEVGAQVYWRALQVGDPVVLTGEQMREARERYRLFSAGGAE